MPGNFSRLIGTPPKSVLSDFSMPMYRNPALSQDQIGMVVVLDLLLRWCTYGRVTWGSIPLALAFGFTQQAAEEFRSFLFVRF